MNTFMLLCLAAFFASMVFALVLTGWKDAFIKACTMRPTHSEAPQARMASLIIPARDAAGTLNPLLQDLYAQQWPKELMEVLVVDDGSTDGTAELVRGMMRNWPALRVIAANGQGKKAAIAQGVAQARGEVIVLTDADARCGPFRVKWIMQAVDVQHADLLLMPVETQCRSGLLQRMQAEEQAALLGVAAGMALTGFPLLANGANMAFSKAAFQAVRGFEGDKWASGDDIFLVRRMQAAGRRMHYLLAPEVLVTVDAEPDFRGFWQQRLRWAGKMRGVSGAGKWGALGGLLLPWFLLCVSMSFSMKEWSAPNPGVCLLLLAAAWLLWLLPVLALAKAVRSFLRAAEVPHRNLGTSVSTLLSFAAFQVYSPVIALLSIFVRPRWKGRSVR